MTMTTTTVSARRSVPTPWPDWPLGDRPTWPDWLGEPVSADELPGLREAWSRYRDRLARVDRWGTRGFFLGFLVSIVLLFLTIHTRWEALGWSLTLITTLGASGFGVRTLPGLLSADRALDQMSPLDDVNQAAMDWLLTHRGAAAPLRTHLLAHPRPGLWAEFAALKALPTEASTVAPGTNDLPTNVAPSSPSSFQESA